MPGGGYRDDQTNEAVPWYNGVSSPCRGPSTTTHENPNTILSVFRVELAQFGELFEVELAIVVCKYVDLDDVRPGLATIRDVDDPIREVAQPLGYEKQLVGVERQVEGRLRDMFKVIDKRNPVRVELPVRESAVIGDVDGLMVHPEAAA